MPLEAVVVKHTGSHYLLAHLPKWDLFPAVLRGKIRLKGSTATNPIAVGDKVRYKIEADTAVITEILERKNYIIRKSTNLSRQAHIIAANIERAFLVVTLAFPEVKLQFLDRLLVTCEVYGVKPVIVLNKIDILKGEFADEFSEQLESFRNIYESAGYQIIEASAITGEGIDEIRSLCHMDSSQYPVSLFSGVSGVGKSSLIKALNPELTPRTGEISDVHLQGKHTTTFYEMYPLSESAFIIDTPGIRGFGLVDLDSDEIAKYFPEMLKASEDCKFTPCTHTHEPKCAVKVAVDEGSISAERYNSYLGMLEENGKYR